MEAALVRLERDRNNGDETPQGGEKLVRLVPRQKHLTPCDVRELVQNLYADRAAARDDFLGSCGFLGVGGGEIDEDVRIDEITCHWPRPDQNENRRGAFLGRCAGVRA